MTLMLILMTVFIFIYGIVIGSFLNVCIYRIPKGEDIVKVNSHCMSCGYKLRWFDLIPIFSFLAFRGKCRKCKTKLSAQYPIIEALNGILYVLIFFVCGFSIRMVLLCLMTSALIVVSVIDFRTQIIPFGLNVFIFVLGVIQCIADYKNLLTYVIGFVSVSGFLLLLYLFSKGRAIGDGDIYLMAAAGLLLGWKQIILAFFAGCIIGSVIHLLRMKISKEGHELAFGPYLSAGILISALWGDLFLQWYVNLLIG